jgi:hypothetical protein
MGLAPKRRAAGRYIGVGKYGRRHQHEDEDEYEDVE